MLVVDVNLLSSLTTKSSISRTFCIFILLFTKMAPTRGSKEKKENEESTASLVSSVLADLLGDGRLVELVASHIELAKMREVIDRQEAKIFELESHRDDQKGEIQSLREDLAKKGDEVASLKRDLNIQEQYSRRNSLRFFGIPEQAGETAEESVIQLVKETLKVNLNSQDIDRCHRLKSKTPKKNQQGETIPDPIIVKFVSYKKRSEVLSQRRKLAHSRRSIQEDLTGANAKLLKDTRDHPRVKEAWTRDGRITALIPTSDPNRDMKKLINSKAALDLI